MPSQLASNPLDSTTRPVEFLSKYPTYARLFSDAVYAGQPGPVTGFFTNLTYASCLESSNVNYTK